MSAALFIRTLRSKLALKSDASEITYEAADKVTVTVTCLKLIIVNNFLSLMI